MRIIPQKVVGAPLSPLVACLPGGIFMTPAALAHMFSTRDVSVWYDSRTTCHDSKFRICMMCMIYMICMIYDLYDLYDLLICRDLSESFFDGYEHSIGPGFSC